MILRLRRRRDQVDAPRGQALVEFALVLPIFVLFLMGIWQFGLIFSAQIGLINGTREAARYGATVQTSSGTAATTNAAAVMTQLQTALQRNVTGFSSGQLVTTGTSGPRKSEVTYCTYEFPTGKFHVRMRVQSVYRHPLIVPIVGALIDGLDYGDTPGQFEVRITEEMRVENQPLDAAPAGIAAC